MLINVSTSVTGDTFHIHLDRHRTEELARVIQGSPDSTRELFVVLRALREKLEQTRKPKEDESVGGPGPQPGAPSPEPSESDKVAGSADVH